jgi:uncharacterized protein
MILKALLVGAVIYIVYIMFFKQKSVTATKNGHKKEQKPQANEMVECANCAVYVEISEAILSNGKYYCSNECIIEAKK